MKNIYPIANFRQSVHLSCSLGQVVSEEEVEWDHYSKTKGRYTVQFATERHVITSERGIEEDSGWYDCVQGGQLVSVHWGIAERYLPTIILAVTSVF